MSNFKGTIEGFNKYLGGYCRNKVMSMTAKERRSHGGICQHCKGKAELRESSGKAHGLQP